MDSSLGRVIIRESQPLESHKEKTCDIGNMSDRFNVSIDDPERDIRLNRESFLRRLCELDEIARRNGRPTTFPLEEIWTVQQAFDQDTYSKSTIDELTIEGLIHRDENNRFGLTDMGRETHCR